MADSSEPHIAPPFAELERMTEDDLKRQYDEARRVRVIDVDFYLDELRRRTFARQQRWMVGMTIANLIVAAVAAFAAVVSLLD